MKKKLTLKEFWDSPYYIGIHCQTYEDARDLCHAFEYMGRKWADGDRYLDGEDYRWNIYKENTVYNNSGDIDNFKYVKSSYPIYEYEYDDIDFSTMF